MNGEHRKKLHRFTVRLFPEELIILMLNAREYGADMTEFIYTLIVHGTSLESRRPIFADETFKRLLREVNHIGNNMNQIAYNSHLRKSVGKEMILEQKGDFEVLLNLYLDTFLYPTP